MVRPEAMHVILGAGGAVGAPLAHALLDAGRRLRTVSRTGRGPGGAEARSADLTIPGQLMEAVEERSTVYLLAGLAYNRKVWKTQWPLIMRNVLAACRAKSARLIFLDNVYLYGRTDGPMTEDTPVRPTSVKGEIRAGIAAGLLAEAASGRLEALIARSADFYGPFSERSSFPYLLVLRRLAEGKAAQVFARVDTLHSYTYTLDIAKALLLLADADDVWNQVWHLPTASPALTGRQFVELAARELGVPPRFSVVPRRALAAAGLFSTQMRELAEMMYQNESDYLFDSSKFEKRFRFTPTRYEEGIRESVKGFARNPSR